MVPVAVGGALPGATELAVLAATLLLLVGVLAAVVAAGVRLLGSTDEVPGERIADLEARVADLEAEVADERDGDG